MLNNKASGTTINQSCMTGACEDHRIALLEANTEYYADVQLYKQRLYMSWIAFGIIGMLAVIGRSYL